MANSKKLPYLTVDDHQFGIPPSPRKSKIRVVMIDPHPLGNRTVNTGKMHTPLEISISYLGAISSQLQRTQQRSNISCVVVITNSLLNGLKIIFQGSVMEYFLSLGLFREESFPDTKLR